MKFTYRSGQRPLDGYTIKRGVGQGGFGEVYFAVSDGGKEVALKLLHRHPDAELRGIGHCLNLKNPNLVHLYDLRTDDRGDKWVVMEYVFGESLAQWINRYPTGLPTELVKEWFAAIARGVAYLHDHGVVHRDLKPANIFVEHGHLKIGDYGLSRRISASQGGDVTRGVGTPYYMAPEIKNGNYSTSIDVYACGVILYEMLTGHPPFEGQSAEEVLIKHQTDKPDLSKLPAPFRPLLEQALDKDPWKRFGSMKDFAKAVEAVAEGRPMPDLRAAETVAANAIPVADLAPIPRAIPVAAANGAANPKYASGPITRAFREKLTDFLGAAAIAPVVAALCTAPWAVFQSPIQWALLGRVFLLSTALGWGALLVSRPPTPGEKSSWGRRLNMLFVGLAVGALAFWLDGWAVPGGLSHPETSRDLVIGSWARISPETLSVAMRYLFYFGVTAAACKWWAMTDRRRKERFRFLPVVGAGFWGGVLMFLWPWEVASPALGIAPLVIAAVAAQVASPWTPPPPQARPVYRAERRRRPVGV